MGNRLGNHRAVVAISVCTLFFAGCQRRPETTLQPSSQTATPSLTPVSPLAKREPIFFIKGDATLSPGAMAKLKVWVDTWGVSGKWKLACPSGPGLTYDLLERRLLAIRAELRKLGITKVETTLLPNGPVGQYDAIYVEKESFP